MTALARLEEELETFADDLEGMGLTTEQQLAIVKRFVNVKVLVLQVLVGLREEGP